MEHIECPICSSLIRPHNIGIRSIPWSDCACSDSGLCFFHQYGPERPPPRPDEDELKSKLSASQAEASVRFHEKIARRDGYRKMLSERERMLELLRAIMADEATDYGYRDFAKRLFADMQR